MSLHISFVQPSVNEAYMVEAFEDTFGATVSVEFTKVRLKTLALHAVLGEADVTAAP